MPNLNQKKDKASSRWGAMLVTLAVHLLALCVLRSTWHQTKAGNAAEPVRVQWIVAKPDVAVKAAIMRNVALEGIRRPLAPGRRAVAVAAHETPAADTAPTQSDPALARPVAPSENLNLDQLLKDVGRDVAKMDDAENKAHPGRTSTAPGESQSKLERVIAAATAASPPKWYQAARVVEITSGGAEADGGRRYQLITAFGTYCVFYPADGSPKIISLCKEL